MKKRPFTKYEDLLAKALRAKIANDDTYIGSMLAMIVDHDDSDEICRKLYEFIQNNPTATEEEILDKQNEILGFEDPFADDDESND